jgi:hypothetical protein
MRQYDIIGGGYRNATGNTYGYGSTKLGVTIPYKWTQDNPDCDDGMIGCSKHREINFNGGDIIYGNVSGDKIIIPMGDYQAYIPIDNAIKIGVESRPTNINQNQEQPTQILATPQNQIQTQTVSKIDNSDQIKTSTNGLMNSTDPNSESKWKNPLLIILVIGIGILIYRGYNKK